MNNCGLSSRHPLHADSCFCIRRNHRLTELVLTCRTLANSCEISRIVNQHPQRQAKFRIDNFVDNFFIPKYIVIYFSRLKYYPLHQSNFLLFWLRLPWTPSAAPHHCQTPAFLVNQSCPVQQRTNGPAQLQFASIR